MGRILLADDNSGLRSALRLFLETRLDFELIVEARDMEHVLAQVEDSLPDCIILDWELPGRPVHERVAVLRSLAPRLKVIAFSARPESKAEAFGAGVDAFVCKTESPIVVLEELQKTLANPEVTVTLVKHPGAKRSDCHLLDPSEPVLLTRDKTIPWNGEF